ncbi:MAG: hypothetical protein RIS94_1599 [Pseudomonadota bacterium]
MVRVDYVEVFYNPVLKRAKSGMLSPVKFARGQTLEAESDSKTRGYSLRDLRRELLQMF